MRPSGGINESARTGGKGEIGGSGRTIRSEWIRKGSRDFELKE